MFLIEAVSKNLDKRCQLDTAKFKRLVLEIPGSLLTAPERKSRNDHRACHRIANRDSEEETGKNPQKLKGKK
jgi:hypothetical protein